MGAEQSAESKRRNDEKYQRMMTVALEQQRKKYEEKCKELLLEQQRIKTANENLNIQSTPQSSPLTTPTPANYAPLYPNLQQNTNINIQPSTSTACHNTQPSNMPNQRNSVQPFVQDALVTQANPGTHSIFKSKAFDITSASLNALPNLGVSNPKPHSSASFDCQPSAPTLPGASSATQRKQRPNLRNKEHDAYQCPSCKINRLENNIFQCQKGHSSCNQCKTNAVNCGICRSPISNTRNIELERIVANLQLKNVHSTEKVYCPNRGDGCCLYIKQEHLQVHLKECMFREMECPVALAKYCECSWRGKINQIQAHFLEYHPAQTGASVDTEMLFDRYIDRYVLHHTAMGNFNFLIHIKLDHNVATLFMSVQLIGSLKSASKWSYEIHLYDKSEPRRKFTYVDKCLPTSIPFSEVSKESNCVALPMQYALSFFKNNKVTYKFYIKREETKRDPRPRGPRSAQSET